MKLSVDRLPLVIYIAVLLGTWLAADYFFTSTILVKPSPELPVWAAYDRSTVAALLAYAIAGLLLALAVPLGHQSGGSVAANIQASASRLKSLWWVLALVSLAASVYVKGPFLYHAPLYLTFAAPPALVSLAGSMQPLGVLATGIVSVRRPVIGLVGLVLWAVVLFSYATRLFAAVVVLYLVGRWMGGARVRVLTWLVGGLSALVLLPVPLTCRQLPAHGLFPYWQGMTTLLGRPGYASSAAHTIASNVGFGIPLLVKTSQETGITPNDMLISINPAPTRIAGWDRILESMRIHEFIPYSAMGEWARFGGLALFGFTLAWGLIVRLSLVSILKSTSPLKVLFLAAALGVSLISMVLTLQYNTRAVARMLDIIVVIAVGEAITNRLLRGLTEWRSAVQPRSRSSEVGA